MACLNIVSLCAADGAMAEIRPRGAHVTAWKPVGAAQDRLFLSEKAVFAEGVAIRGGVPVIFPQFAGEGPLPKHGFARTALWVLSEQTVTPSGEATATFALTANDATRKIWPYVFRAKLVVAVGGSHLTTTLHITNTGTEAFSFTAALHTYLQVDEISAARIAGLHGLHYRDTASGGVMRHENSQELTISGEVDRNYFDAPSALTLRDERSSLRIEQQGFVDTVVWNPGAASSANFKDLAADDYRRFVCIEAAAIQHPITLQPGVRWQGSQALRTE